MLLRGPRLRPVTRAALSVVLAWAAPARAQDLRVRLLDQESRQPLAGVLVSALGSKGERGVSTLTSADGIAVVRFSGAAPFRLLVRRIGFAPVTTEQIALAADRRAIVDVVVPSHRIVLGTVTVLADQQCGERAASPSANAENAWTEVQKALESSVLTRDQRMVSTSALTLRRTLRTDGRIDRTDTTQRGRSGDQPFYAPAAAVLERDGYFKTHDDGSENFYAPDERALLSPGFARLHCITARPDVRHDAGATQLALAFVPRDRATRPDIKGLIWIDSATSELRRVEFEYVRVPLPAPADSLGGSVTFEHLTSGAWIVSSWVLRIPHWQMVDRRRNYVLLNGYTEVGGSASVITDVAIPAMSAPRTIAGIVYDSVTRTPLAGAHVHLADLARDTVADSLGAFRFDNVSAGVHSLWADHPAVDALGLYALEARVDATPRLVTSFTLAVPSFLTLWHRACGSSAVPRDGDAFVFGRVAGAPRDSTATEGVAGAVVDVRWTLPHSASDPAPAREGELQVSTSLSAPVDSTGGYAICGVPSDRAVTIDAKRRDAAAMPASFTIGSARIARRDLTLSRGVMAAATTRVRSVRVVSGDGKPVVYANVSVDGGIVQITDGHGETTIAHGTRQAFTVAVTRIGFARWFGKIDFADTASVLTVTLASAAQSLGEVRVTGHANTSSPFVQGFYDRWLMRQKGVLSATFIGPEEIESRHPDLITNMLRGLNGVSMINFPCPTITNCLVAVGSVSHCEMTIMIDGLQQRKEMIPGTKPPIYAVFIDQILEANDVMGIEVYARGGNMPISLQASDAGCGVIAIWTGSRK